MTFAYLNFQTQKSEAILHVLGNVLSQTPLHKDNAEYGGESATQRKDQLMEERVS